MQHHSSRPLPLPAYETPPRDNLPSGRSRPDLRCVPSEFDASIDYRAAAGLFIASLRNGHRVRSLRDCLVAAVAIPEDVPLFQRDRDYEFLAEITPLRFVEAG